VDVSIVTVRYRLKAINGEGWQSDFSEERVVQW
jgi:hypothetical protein